MNAQAMQALQRANSIRLARSQLKKEVKSGERTFRSLLDDPPECCAHMPVFDVLQWCPKVGYSRAKSLTRGVLSETLELRFLRGRTRDELLEHLSKGGVQ